MKKLVFIGGKRSIRNLLKVQKSIDVVLKKIQVSLANEVTQDTESLSIKQRFFCYHLLLHFENTTPPRSQSFLAV